MALAVARGETRIHFLEWFYMGLRYYEQRDYTTAIQYLDKALARYPRFQMRSIIKACISSSRRIRHRRRL